MSIDCTTKDMSDKSINERIKLFIESVLKVTPYEFSKSLGKNRPDWLYRILKNEVAPSPKTLEMIFNKYPRNKLWILTGQLANTYDREVLGQIDQKLKAQQKLNSILKNRNVDNRNEGSIIDDSDLVPVLHYIIPITGQAGLNKAFFYADEYIEDNFEKELSYVLPADRNVYYNIEVDGYSMPGVLEPGDWAKCVEVPKNLWLEKDTFKKDKIYCLFHKNHGILFKRISKVFLDSITLSSDNVDKEEYPDQDFDLMEFSKILEVKRKEVIFY